MSNSRRVVRVPKQVNFFYSFIVSLKARFKFLSDLFVCFFRFEEVDNWMNLVDENVKLILKQLTATQDFDKEKEAFFVS